MRTFSPWLLALSCGLLIAGLAAAEDDRPSAAEEQRRTLAVLTSRFLPPDAARSAPLIERPQLAAMSVPLDGESLLMRVLDLRLRGLSGPRPADPRRASWSGDLALRVPLGETIDLRPGMRVDYARRSVGDLSVSTPVPTLGLSMRF